MKLIINVTAIAQDENEVQLPPLDRIPYQALAESFILDEELPAECELLWRELSSFPMRTHKSLKLRYLPFISWWAARAAATRLGLLRSNIGGRNVVFFSAGFGSESNSEKDSSLLSRLLELNEKSRRLLGSGTIRDARVLLCRRRPLQWHNTQYYSIFINTSRLHY